MKQRQHVLSFYYIGINALMLILIGGVSISGIMVNINQNQDIKLVSRLSCSQEIQYSSYQTNSTLEMVSPEGIYVSSSITANASLQFNLDLSDINYRLDNLTLFIDGVFLPEGIASIDINNDTFYLFTSTTILNDSINLMCFSSSLVKDGINSLKLNIQASGGIYNQVFISQTKLLAQFSKNEIINASNDGFDYSYSIDGLDYQGHSIQMPSNETSLKIINKETKYVIFNEEIIGSFLNINLPADDHLSFQFS